VVTEVSGLFKEMTFRKPKLRSFVDFHSKTLSETAAAVSKTNMDGWLAQKIGLENRNQGRPEIGGKLGEVKAPGSGFALYTALGPENAQLVKDFNLRWLDRRRR